MRRAKAEGRGVGRPPVQVDRDAILKDHEAGMSLRKIAETHKISKSSVAKNLKTEKTKQKSGVFKPLPQPCCKRLITQSSWKADELYTKELVYGNRSHMRELS